MFILIADHPEMQHRFFMHAPVRIKQFLKTYFFSLTHFNFVIYKYLILLGLVKKITEKWPMYAPKLCLWSAVLHREHQEWSEQPNSTWPPLLQGELLWCRCPLPFLAAEANAPWFKDGMRNEKKKLELSALMLRVFAELNHSLN